MGKSLLETYEGYLEKYGKPGITERITERINDAWLGTMIESCDADGGNMGKCRGYHGRDSVLLRYRSNHGEIIYMYILDSPFPVEYYHTSRGIIEITKDILTIMTMHSIYKFRITGKPSPEQEREAALSMLLRKHRFVRIPVPWSLS